MYVYKHLYIYVYIYIYIQIYIYTPPIEVIKSYVFSFVGIYWVVQAVLFR
jgi:hypothetical protein